MDEALDNVGKSQYSKSHKKGASKKTDEEKAAESLAKKNRVEQEKEKSKIKKEQSEYELKTKKSNEKKEKLKYRANVNIMNIEDGINGKIEKEKEKYKNIVNWANMVSDPVVIYPINTISEVVHINPRSLKERLVEMGVAVTNGKVRFESLKGIEAKLVTKKIDIESEKTKKVALITTKLKKECDFIDNQLFATVEVIKKIDIESSEIVNMLELDENGNVKNF
jgi:hypothetical protein